MSEENTDTEPVGPRKIIQLDESQLRAHLDRQVVECVEETLNKLLDAEAERICGAARYEHSPDRQIETSDMIVLPILNMWPEVIQRSAEVREVVMLIGFALYNPSFPCFSSDEDINSVLLLTSSPEGMCIFHTIELPE